MGCPITAKFLLSNTTQTGGRTTEVRSLSRRPPPVSSSMSVIAPPSRQNRSLSRRHSATVEEKGPEESDATINGRAPSFRKTTATLPSLLARGHHSPEENVQDDHSVRLYVGGPDKGMRRWQKAGAECAGQ